MTAGLGSAFVTVLAETSGFESSLTTSFNKMASVGAKMLAIGVGVGAADIVSKSVKLAGDFQFQMQRMVDAAGESQKNLALVSAGVKQIMQDTGTTADEATKGLYIIESAGLHGADALTVLASAAKGAKIENADLSEVANAVSSAMVDYHYSASQANDVTNTLIAAVGQGKTTMGDMATAFVNVAAAGASVHIPITDLSSAIAEMTDHGTSASKAGTYLRQVISALEVQSAAGAKEMAGLGINALQLSADLSSGPGGLLKAVQDVETGISTHMKGGFVELQTLTKAASGSTTQFDTAMKNMNPTFQTQFGALSKMVGGVRSLQGFLQLGGENLQKFKDITDKVNTAVAGAGGQVNGWDKVQGTFNNTMDRAKASLEVMGINIGTALLPKLTDLFNYLMKQGPAIEAFWKNNLQQPIEDIGKALDNVDWHAVFTDLKAVMEGLAAPLGAIVVALPSIIGFMSDLANIITPFTPILSTFVGLWATFKIATSVWGTLAGLAKTAFGGVAAETTAAKGATSELIASQDLLKASIDRVTGAIDFQSRALTGLDSSYAVAAADAGKFSAAEDLAAGSGAAGGAEGMLAKFGSASVGGVPAPLLAGAAIGAGIAQLLSNYDTPSGFHNNNELSLTQWTTGLQNLQKELDSVSDAHAKAQLQELMQNALSTNDAQDHMAGALKAAQDQVDKFDTSHGIAENVAYRNSVLDLGKSANDGTDAVAKLIAAGKITPDTSGLQQIDAQLAALVRAGNAAAQSIFNAERQAAGLTTNANISLSDAQSVAGEDQALANAASGGYGVDQYGASMAPTAPTPVSVPSGAGGSSGGTGGSKGAAAASAAKAALKKVGTDLVTIAKGIGKDTTSAMDNVLSNLYADLQSANVGKKVLDQAKTTWTELNKLAASRDANITAINDQNNAIKTLQGSMTSLHNSVEGTFTSIVDVAKYGQAGTSVLFSDLHRTLAASTDFANDIKTLAKMGLNQGALQELLNAGPATGDAAAKQLIAAGQAAITGQGGINDLMGQIQAQGDQLGTSMATQFYQHGIDVANGLIKGLQSQNTALENQMTKLGDSMATAFKKTLGIKSPSTVFMGHGANIVAGLVQGIESSASSAYGAMDKLGSQMGNWTAGPANAGGIQVWVQIGEEQIEPQIVRIMNNQDRIVKARAGAGSKVGNVAGRLM